MEKIDYSKITIGTHHAGLNRTIKEIISKDFDHIVYIDSKNVICTSNDPTFEVTPEFGKIQNKISYWESICNRVFQKREAFDFKCLLAEGYARMYESKDFKAADDIINITINRIKEQGLLILRQVYLMTSFYSTLIILLILVLSIIFEDQMTGYITSDKYEICLAALFGGIGAFISNMVRARHYEAEISSGRRIHRIDGFLRVFYGLIAGVLIAIGVKANLILGVINTTEHNTYVLYFLGAIGGASEWFLPNIIKQFENNKVSELTEIRDDKREGAP